MYNFTPPKFMVTTDIPWHSQGVVSRTPVVPKFKDAQVPLEDGIRTVGPLSQA